MTVTTPAPPGALRRATAPAPPTPAGIDGTARVDRFCLTASLAPAITTCQQQATTGSDHHALLLALTPATAATPPGPSRDNPGP